MVLLIILLMMIVVRAEVVVEVGGHIGARRDGHHAHGVNHLHHWVVVVVGGVIVGVAVGVHEIHAETEKLR